MGAWLDYYRTHSGREFMDQHKMHYTDYASIQVMFTTLLSRKPLTYTNKHSWASLCSGLLEPPYTQRPTAGYYRVSPSSSLGGQKYCKNFLKPIILTQSSLLIRRAQHQSSWCGCWRSRGRRGCPQLFQGGRRQSWKTASKGATSPKFSKLLQIILRSFSTFQTCKMAALVKKAPALLNAARELAQPKLNTFLRYAKVNNALE